MSYIYLSLSLSLYIYIYIYIASLGWHDWLDSKLSFYPGRGLERNG